MTSKIKVDNINKVSDDSNIINKCGTAINVGAAGNTVTVTGNDIRSDSYKAADGGVIASQSGTTITLGASGDTVTLASGASQTGFGRTGTVDWTTTPVTSTPTTGVSGVGYFINSTGGAKTVNLPASPSAGDIMAVADYAGTAATHNITIGRNGSNIEGIANDAVLNTNRDSVTLVFVDGTQGWIAVNSNDAATITPAFIAASGGNATITCGDFKTHIFTGPGTFTVSCAGNPLGSATVDYFVVAGGGGGHADGGAGAGAGGFRIANSYGVPGPTMSPLANPSGLSVTATGFPIVVGGGGAAVTQGSTSTFSTISSAGGGASNGNTGGSGGGGRANGPNPGGAGNTPPVSPPQGNNGGDNPFPVYSGAAGGGGAGAVGNNATKCTGGNGGSGSYVATAFGIPSSYGDTGPVGSTRYFAGGGGGAYDGAPGPAGSGGAGGGGAGQNGTGGSGATNSGSGAGGGRANPAPSGGSGGSGIVMIRYKFQ
jgi:hypothetical protein